MAETNGTNPAPAPTPSAPAPAVTPAPVATTAPKPSETPPSPAPPPQETPKAPEAAATPEAMPLATPDDFVSTPMEALGPPPERAVLTVGETTYDLRLYTTIQYWQITPGGPVQCWLCQDGTSVVQLAVDSVEQCRDLENQANNWFRFPYDL